MFRLPRHPYTRGLLRSVATLDTVRGTKLHSIEGSIPSLAALPQGCRFHPRCPFATERCTQEAPILTGSGERRSACWHAEELVQSEGWMAPWRRRAPVQLRVPVQLKVSLRRHPMR
ncbi:oligopeptide/dipeptide ABC transporter ATP-binding protein [Paenibacillus sp. JTLBN-2024]